MNALRAVARPGKRNQQCGALRGEKCIRVGNQIRGRYSVHGIMPGTAPAVHDSFANKRAGTGTGKNNLPIGVGQESTEVLPDGFFTFLKLPDDGFPQLRLGKNFLCRGGRDCLFWDYHFSPGNRHRLPFVSFLLKVSLPFFFVKYFLAFS